MSDWDSGFVPESSGPVGQAFKIGAALVVGTGVSIAGYSVFVMSTHTCGAQRSTKIEWEKRQVEIDKAIQIEGEKIDEANKPSGE